MSITTTKESVKKSEPQLGAPRSKKIAEITAKRTEKRENAKEVRKLAAKASAKEASKDTETIKTFPSDLESKVTVSNREISKEITSDNKEIKTFVTTTTISLSTAPIHSIERVVENLAPPRVASDKKTQNDKQIKQTARDETIPAAKPTPTTTNTKTASSSNNSNSTVKEKDKSKEKEKLRKDSEVI